MKTALTEAAPVRLDTREQKTRTPSSLVRRELARALIDGALLPFRALRFASRRRALRAELTSLLGSEPGEADTPDLGPLPTRPLRIFVSCAEASGEIHARSLVRAIRERLARAGAPPAIFTGVGGERLAADGVEVFAMPVARARMGFRQVFESLPYYLDLLRSTAEHVERQRPDVFVPIDSPALHVPMARIAHHHGVPVVHFVAPQYWGWAPWRARAYRTAVDRALTILPFEKPWFERRGVHAAHVGHPLLDALAHVEPVHERAAGGPLVLLPGSRKSVIELNLPWMLDAAARLRARFATLPIVIAHARAEHEPWLCELVRARGLEGQVEIETGDLHRSLARASAALSVSGTVLIDLLHHRLPAVVIYRLSSPIAVWLSKRVLTVPYFGSVNLLAAREVYPEFAFQGVGPVARIDAAVERALFDEAWRSECAVDLELASRRLGPPGASDRAALHVLHVATKPEGRSTAQAAGANHAGNRQP